jgi:hypothetical protein
MAIVYKPRNSSFQCYIKIGKDGVTLPIYIYIFPLLGLHNEHSPHNVWVEYMPCKKKHSLTWGPKKKSWKHMVSDSISLARLTLPIT